LLTNFATFLRDLELRFKDEERTLNEVHKAVLPAGYNPGTAVSDIIATIAPGAELPKEEDLRAVGTWTQNDEEELNQARLQISRRSAATLVAIDLTGKPSRLTPPSSLNDDEQALFSELVGACDASHFRESDLPLLISYVQSTLISRAAAHDPGVCVRDPCWWRIFSVKSATYP
jgi:hypothetical protein